MSFDMVDMHWKLAAYVARGGIKPSPFDTPQTFTRIMQERPNDCRFAIAQAVRIRPAKGSTNKCLKYATDTHPSGPFVVWDLLDEQLTRGQRANAAGLLAPPPPMWMADSEDGMCMKALAFYDHHP